MSTFLDPGFESSIISSMRDLDMSNLAAENKALTAELAQCKADKDFVWSLWKRLQVSNPDVTEALSLVIQREKEKSEAKDRKVLEIIQVKDDRIEEIQNIIARQSQEISDILARKAEMTDKSGRFQLDNDRLQERIHRLETQLKSEENKERSLENTFRKTVEGSEKEKYDLSRQVSQLMTELEITKSEKDHAVNRQQLLEERAGALEKEVSLKMIKFEKLVREVEDSTGRLTRYESQTAKQRRDLDFKNQELENVRKELKELWLAHNQLTEHSGQQADLIRQLQSLQQDTQKMLKNQEDAFTLESTSLQQMFTDVNTRYEVAKRTESDLRQQVLELKKSLMDKDDIISSLQSQADLKDEADSLPDVNADYSSTFLDIVTEADSMHEDKTRRRKERGRSLTTVLRDPHFKTADVVRSRSLSPQRGMENGQSEHRNEGHGYHDKLEAAERALHFKNREMEELRRAHDSRLQRLQSLRSSYKLARDEIRTLGGGSKIKGKNPKRASGRSLQKENSDQVWNELSFFKAENRSMQVEKMDLQEELDLLRVQTSQDAATIHELTVSTQSLKDEYEFQFRKFKRDMKENRGSENQLSVLKSQVQNKTVHIEKLERDMMNTISQRDDLMQEKSKLMSQLVCTQQEASKHRMELADAKHRLQSLQFEMEEQKYKLDQAAQEKSTGSSSAGHGQQGKESSMVTTVASRLMSKQRKLKKNKNSPAAKKYQKTLNTSIEKMSDVFHDFNEEGWEEISEPESESEIESDVTSLGESIAKQSQDRKPPHAGKSKAANLGKKKPHRVPTHHSPSAEDKQRSTDRTSCPRVVTLRECATSPISFLSPSSAPVVEASSSSSPTQVCSASSSLRSSRRTIENRQMAALKNRIHHLQQQVSLLKKSRFAAIKFEEELKETINKLQCELSNASGRLKTAKQQVTKLQGEKLQVEKDNKHATNTTDKDEEKKMVEAQEIKVLEAKLKVAISDASRHSAAMRNLKTDNDSLQDQVRTLQDRINHLERDVNQKRSLLESQRMKLKHVQDVSKSDANSVEELQTRTKLLTDGNNKLKVQIDSLKKRLSVVLKDKKDYEQKFLKVSLELEHKAKLLNQSATQKASLEAALSELEMSAQHQLHGLASQSEAAIDAAKDRLMSMQAKIAQFQALVKIFGTELIKRTERARCKMKEAKASQERSQREEDMSLQRAQNKARDILNLSLSDLEDIMSADGDSSTQGSVTGDEQKLDRRWLRKCQKLTTDKDDFVQALTSLLLQKVDERADLLLKIPRST